MLSRGYKRKTAGFRIATEKSTYEEIGDEPLQIKQKFPDIMVAVDGNRVRGVKSIVASEPDTDIVLLDDAYQHRWVTPGVSILLINYERPIFNDFLLPSGRLREFVSGKKRADIIIVSKTPANISAIDKRLLLMKINALSHQTVYFTTVRYGSTLPVFPGIEPVFVPFDKPTLSVLLVTGIANAEPLVQELKKRYAIFEHLNFPDHYSFKDSDVQQIQDLFDAMPGTEKVVFTTEKDAARLINFEYQIKERERWHYLPIEIEFHPGEAELFNRQILHYVTNNSRNSLLFKK
jgi:tetraacyldisaccharide 4'-kinase